MIKSGLFGLVCGITLADCGMYFADQPVLVMFYVTFLTVAHEVLK